MDATSWLAQFEAQRAAVGEAFLAARAEMHRTVGERIRRELHPESVRVVAGVPVVLEPAAEVGRDELDSCPVAAARRVTVAALAAGWSTRVTRALAAVPRTGLVESWAVRCARAGDERLWACWWNGSFDSGQYFRVGGSVEPLGAERMSLVPPAVIPVDAMTVGQIKTLAVERGIKIPSKYVKAAIVEHVKAQGLVASMPPPRVRGVLDAVEGLHLARHLVGAAT